MENSSNNLAEELAYETHFENQAEDFTSFTFSHTGPGDEDEEETAGNDDDNPPVDEEVVHSPVTPETGGRPEVAPR